MTTATHFSSRTAFIFAAAAAAVGLGNIWRFPYLAGQNGGGAFVLIYLFFVIVLGIPLMTSEVVLGRIGQKNPIASFSKIARDIGRSKHWRMVGGLAILTGFLIVSYYAVISGWVFDYFIRSLAGHFHRVTEVSAISDFQNLQKSPWQMLFSDTIVMTASVSVVSLGIKNGLERTVMLMFPALLLILLVLLGYSMTTGHFQQGLDFLFSPKFYQATPKVVLEALGQAFFSLNIAMGVIILFSAYLPKKTPLVSSIFYVVFFDTMIALLSGLIIFPIVFANNLAPAAGPSLIFRTLPLAFSQLPGGSLISALFFLLLLFAAFTSTISLLEVVGAWLCENHGISRKKSVILSGIACWVLSLGTITSFSAGHILSIHGITFFDAIDFITSGIMLPLGGLLVAIFTGWLVPAAYFNKQLNWPINNIWFRCWQWVKRYFAPVAILLILLTSLKLI